MVVFAAGICRPHTPSVREQAHEQHAILRRGGALIETAQRPIQVRNTDGANIETREGAFMSSPLPIAGFAVIEADDLPTAIAMISGVPCAVEVWPIEEPQA